MDIRIEYEGFADAPTSRVYNFLVTGVPGAFRRFTVKVPSEAFRSTSLKFQDGPPLCFELLKQELDRVMQELPVKAHLNIGEEDIQEYLERHSKRKKRKRT